MEDLHEQKWFDDDDILNRNAFRALSGFVGKRREEALIELLESDAPIHRVVRRAIAEALRGNLSFGAPLRFDGTTKTRELAKAYEKREEWMRIGKRVQALKSKGMKHNDALLTAAGEFSSSREKCEAAERYLRRADQWIASVMIPGTMYGTWSREHLEGRFIGFDASGTPLPPNKTAAEVAEDNLRQFELLKQMFPDVENSK